jgi:mannose-6-phosphate isomerase-like protein (cupin superfamily)
MKKYNSPIKFLLLFIVALISSAFIRQQKTGYILEHEKDIAKEQPGPHDGRGTTTGYSFFSKAADLKIVFRKRVLKPGASIGYHLQKDDEIYYIISGTGIMNMNGESFAVKAGDAILTRPGSSHDLQQTGNEDLAIIINYQVK